MPIDEAKMKTEFPRLKSLLTRAKRTKSPQKVLDAVAEAYKVFEAIGYPDDWRIWENAKDDAMWAKASGLAEWDFK